MSQHDILSPVVYLEGIEHISKYRNETRCSTSTIAMFNCLKVDISIYGMYSISLNSCGKIVKKRQQSEHAGGGGEKKISHARRSMVRTCSELRRGREQLQTAGDLLPRPPALVMNTITDIIEDRGESLHLLNSHSNMQTQAKPRKMKKHRNMDQKPAGTHIKLDNEQGAHSREQQSFKHSNHTQ